jgi:phenylacetate-CoA ligase
MTKEYTLAQKKAFLSFQKVLSGCEAYSQFFKKNKLKIKKLTPSHFQQIPMSDKNNYFRKYPLEKKLYRNRKLSEYYFLSTSSGSTGEPTIWPREYQVDNKLELLFTDYLDTHFKVKNRKTLFVITFGLGSSTGGMLHARFAWESSKHGRISVITPGVDPETTVSLIQRLYKHYDQVVCIGYPPLISEFVDLAIKKRYSIKKWNMKICFTSESTSAAWRSQTAKKISQTGNPKNIIAFYACSEAGIIGTESPETMKIIKHCLNDEDLRIALFNDTGFPTLVEVNMKKKFVEIVDGEIVITVDQPLPLVRYNLHDRGMFIKAKTIKKILSRNKIAYHPKDLTKTFLAVFGKSEMVGKHKLIFHIEDIRYALEHVSSRKKLTGTFKYKEKEMKNVLILQLKVYLKKEKRLTKKEKGTFEKEALRLLKKVKKTQNHTLSLPLSLKVTFTKEDKKTKYQKGKLRYFL